MTFEEYLQHHHRLTPSETEIISDTPGYWRIKNACPGGANCRHAFRGAIGSCAGGKKLTIYYTEQGLRDKKGRYVSPYREWRSQLQALAQ